MRIKLVKSLHGGEILAEPVITEEKEVLISAGTKLKTEYLDLISFLGIDTVCIEDPYIAFESPHQMICENNKNEYISRVQAVLEKHTYDGKENLKKIESVADDLMHELMVADDSIVIDMDERNGNLYEHTIMVTILSTMIARKLKLKEEQIYELVLGSLLHDLGLRYITVPYINCDLTSESSEVFEYKKHTILAYSALENETWINTNVKRMILSHHERKDGSGFPLKQKVKDIECNILQVCDVFDGMISGVECKRVSVQSALEYLVETSDVLFDKRVVKVLEKLVARYPVGTVVKLTTGENGVVISQTSDSVHPVIAVLDPNEKISDVVYDLSKSKKVSILQVIS